MTDPARKGGTGDAEVDGAEVAKQTIPHTIPFLVTFDESFDVGIDTRTPVDDADYKVPFAFTGTIDKLTVKAGKPQLDRWGRGGIRHGLRSATKDSEGSPAPELGSPACPR